MTIFKKKRVTKRSVTKRKVTRAKKPSMVRLIKNTITGMAEHKATTYTGNYNVLSYNGTSWNSFNLFPITPYPGFVSIVQGTGQGDRIGNEIRTVSMSVKFCFFPLPYQVTSNPIPIPLELIIYVFEIRNNNLLPTSLGNFFEVGDTATAPTGIMTDFLRPINKDIYIVHKKIVRKLGYAAAVGTGFQANYQQYANNDYKYNQIVNINCTKWMPKVIKYNDTTTIPLSKSLMIATMVVNSDGSSNAVGIVPAQAYVELSYKYSDM